MNPAAASNVVPSKHDIVVVIGEALHDAVAAREPPAPAQRGGAGVELGLQPADMLLHSLISTNGMFGIAPAAKRRQIDLEIIGVEAHRHVEQEAGGHRRAPRRHVPGEERHEAGRGIDGERRALRRSVPATATRTLPATGLAIGRC